MHGQTSNEVFVTCDPRESLGRRGNDHAGGVNRRQLGFALGSAVVIFDDVIKEEFVAGDWVGCGLAVVWRHHGVDVDVRVLLAVEGILCVWDRRRLHIVCL